MGGTSAAAAARRTSMPPHFAQQQINPNPPLPYQPQAHFFGATNIENFDIQPQAGLKAGERGYYFGFDTLPCLNADHVPGKGNVVLAGYEGGLEVHAVGRRGVDRIASLKGLRGGVYNAKLLPWSAQNADGFPLVAVVVHGPAFPLPAPGANSEGGYDAVSADRSEAISNANPTTGARGGGTPRPTPGFIEAYQTTVEVYSLKTNKLVQVLLEAPKVLLSTPITSPIFKPPPPTGAFNIKADASNIVVASGVTGECWVYRHMVVPSEQHMQFVCLGKVWTTLQHTQTEDFAMPRNGQSSPRPTQRPVTAVFSLNGRWLAYCPARPQSQITLRADLPIPRYGKTPGLSSMTAPQPPSINAEADLPTSESVMNKIMRDATQELIQGAKWVGQQGWSAWNKYWNPPTQLPSRSPPAGPQGWGGVHAQRPDAAQFPPTHGTVTQPALPKDPGLISIIDLDTLSTWSTPHPVVTFQVPHGCSFLSLAPSGLLLFTASSKGDVHTVWDLMRTHYTRASNLQQPAATAVEGSPRVRQVAQFCRMTVARVVDVAWTRPNGEQAAMVTERGTVHLLDLPSSAFTWPPPRRRIRGGQAQAAGGEVAPSAVAMASNALHTVRNAAGPLMSRQRRSNSNVPVVMGSGLVEGAAYSGKAIVSGISHSLGVTGKAAYNQLRASGEKRVSLPGTGISRGSSCVVWARGRKNHHLMGLGDGVVRKFPSKSRHLSGQGRSARPTRYTDSKLRPLPDDSLSLSVRAYIDPDEYLDLPEQGAAAANNAGLFNDRYLSQEPYTGSAIPQAEIESSAPYQPFHTDRRVSLYESGADSTADGEGGTVPPVLVTNTTVDEASAPPPAPSSKEKRKQQHQQQVTKRPEASEAWAFGQPINATKLDLGLPAVAEAETFNVASDETRALPSSAMETVYRQVGDAEQIVVTTRRRRGPGRGADPDEDGFFEDDCEVLDFADQRV